MGRTFSGSRRGSRRGRSLPGAALIWRASLVFLAATALALPFLHAQFAAVLFLFALLVVFLQVVFRSTAAEDRRPL